MEQEEAYLRTDDLAAGYDGKVWIREINIHVARGCQADEVTVPHSFLFTGAVILPHKAAAGSIECCHDIIHQCIRIGSCGIARHHRGIKGVHAHLDKAVGELEDHVL